MKFTTLASLILAATAEITGVLATGTQTLNTKVSRADKGQQLPSAIPVAKQATSQGCFSSYANMTSFTVVNMSSGSCTKYCISKGFWVAALNGGNCYCGFVYPPMKDKAPDSKCHTPCPSYPPEACGTYPTNGDDSYYSVFNTGINLLPKNYSPPKPSTSSSSSHSSSKHSSTSTSTSASSATSSATDTTTTVTAPPETTTVPSNPDGSNDDNDDNGDNNDNNDNKKSKSSPNVAAIVAGVVVGVVVVGAAIGGGFFFLRRKRNAEIEEEHRRNAAVNAFISGSKPPSSHGSISMTDSRMDPVLAHRRLSDGSIADNQDYSRKILRVTNA